MWHKFTHPKTNPAVALKLALEYGPACIAAGMPTDFAVLIRNESDGRSSTIYFPPPTSSLLVFCPGAVPCEKPSSEGISVLHGERKSLALLFPEP